MPVFSIVRSLVLILHLASRPSFAFVIERSQTRLWFPRSRLAIATKATVGSVVEIDCTLRPEGDFVPDMLFDGIAIDKSDEPKRLKFCLGQGNYVPGLHDLVLAMEVGEMVKDIRIDAGWGDWNPALNVSIAIKALEGNGLETARIKVGTELLMANGMRALVTQRCEDAIVVDANPPLSGASYLATVKLLAVNDPPKDLVYAADSCSSCRYQVATVALGCFWGAELAYMREPGVVGTKGMAYKRRRKIAHCTLSLRNLLLYFQVGYTQGTMNNPTYEEVCTGYTGHNEVVRVVFDPAVVSYDQLLRVFWESHDPTQGNRQGKHGSHTYSVEDYGLTAEQIRSQYKDYCERFNIPMRN